MNPTRLFLTEEQAKAERRGRENGFGEPNTNEDFLLKRLADAHPPLQSQARTRKGPSPDRVAERELIRNALLNGDGFGSLVSTYERFVYRLAFRFTGNHHDACDVTQVVFLRIHRALKNFRGESSLCTWIYTITANTARNSLRAKIIREKTQVLAFSNGTRDENRSSLFEKASDPHAKNPHHEAESRELGLRIQKALMALPKKYREPVILRDVEDFPYGKIAQMLNIKPGTIKTRICRGRAILRTVLKGELSMDCPCPDPGILLGLFHSRVSAS